MDAFKDLNNLYFFAKVVDCGSYTAAAEVLVSVLPSAITATKQDTIEGTSVGKL